MMPRWSYLALIVGCLLEGETTLVTTGFMTHRGFFSIAVSGAIFFITTLALDWSYFFIGRHHGKRFLSKRPSIERKIRNITHSIEKHPTLVMISYRFLYGVRIPVLLAIGLSSHATGQFLLLSVGSTCLWIAVYMFLGYHFGVLISHYFDELKQYEWPIAIGLFVLILLVFLLIKIRSGKASE